jgi:predicted nucleic acid-binding Zn ribbon protein
MSFSEHSWLRRFRSSSCSSDLDADDNSSKTVDTRTIAPHPVSESKNGCRSRAFTINTASSCHGLSVEEFAATLASGHEMLCSEPCIFPFSSLTDECKLHIFAMLSPAERGSVARVCHEWSVLMHVSSLWNTIDLVAFPPYPTVSLTNEDTLTTEESLLLYERYRARMKRYIAFLINIRPHMRFFRFELDIGDVRDGWLEVLQSLLRSSQLQDLEHAELGWTETPGKPYVPDNSSATWCANDCKDLMYRHRHRQRLFVKFFDLFTAVASNIVSLSLPFDWTERSLRALSRLPNLEVLNLQKYFVFQALDQSLIDSLLCSAPLLQHLTMEIWTPSGRGLQKFQFHSNSLKFLDVSRCRGFYVEELTLPHLIEFRVSVCPMNGPLVSAEGVDVKCFYATLQTGTPNLRSLNGYQLRKDWRDSMYDELDALMKSICACSMHQSD